MAVSTPVIPAPSTQRSWAQTMGAALRVRQWLKNGFVSLSLISSGSFLNVVAVRDCAIAIGCFCLLSSSVYLFNDIVDRERDRLHPLKRLRPLASGAMGVRAAAIWCLALLVGALAIADVLLPWPAGALMAAYGAMNVFYTLRGKQMVVVDILLLAAGFAIRVLTGAEAIRVEVSPWLFVVTLFYTLFLALLKRRAELARLDEVAGDHRGVLRHYTPELIDQLATMCGGCTLVCYSLYTFNSVQSNRMMFTIPFVVFAVFRSLYLAHQQGMGGEPEEMVLRDSAMRWNLGLFLAAFVAIVAVHPH